MTGDARVRLALPYVASRSMGQAVALLRALDDDLVGLAEAADAVGRGKTEVSNRSRRPDFPAPVRRLACGPVYSRAEMLSYFAGVDVAESDVTPVSGNGAVSGGTGG